MGQSCLCNSEMHKHFANNPNGFLPSQCTRAAGPSSGWEVCRGVSGIVGEGAWRHSHRGGGPVSPAVVAMYQISAPSCFPSEPFQAATGGPHQAKRAYDAQNGSAGEWEGPLPWQAAAPAPPGDTAGTRVSQWKAPDGTESDLGPFLH